MLGIWPVWSFLSVIFLFVIGMSFIELFHFVPMFRARKAKVQVD